MATESELSYALNAPHPPLVHPSAFTNGHDPAQRQEEEEDDEEDIVEEQLQTKAGGVSATTDEYKPSTAQADPDGKPKRGPGRPRGSRTSKKTVLKATGTTTFFQYPPPPAGPQNAAVHPQHQQYYEFQWRALNLCSEFYNAAEELIKGTSPLVIAQCYQMGPSPKLDPLGMIIEAKRICDNILANPSQLVNSPPPSVYPYTPQSSYSMGGYGAQYAAPSYAAPPYAHPTPYAMSTTQSDSNPTVISNPQSFAMPLGPPTMAPASSYPMYPSRYTAPNYYPYHPPASTSYYTTPAPQASASAPPTSTTPAVNATSPTFPTGYTQGSWSDDEVERLKQLTSESQDQNANKGEIDWDLVVNTWGNSRTRHQILLKATALGLKESTTRGVKRRRGDAEPDSNDTTQQPSNDSASASANLPNTAPESPVHSSSGSRPPSTSPAMATLPHPTSAPATRPNSTTSTNVRWALPTTVPQAEGAYYRQRAPSYSAAQKPGVQHQFMFAPNSAGSS